MNVNNTFQVVSSSNLLLIEQRLEKGRTETRTETRFSASRSVNVTKPDMMITRCNRRAEYLVANTSRFMPQPTHRTLAAARALSSSDEDEDDEPPLRPRITMPAYAAAKPARQPTEEVRKCSNCMAVCVATWLPPPVSGWSCSECYWFSHMDDDAHSFQRPPTSAGLPEPQLTRALLTATPLPPATAYSTASSVFGASAPPLRSHLPPRTGGAMTSPRFPALSDRQQTN